MGMASVVPTACAQTHSSQRQASTTLYHNHISRHGYVNASLITLQTLALPPSAQAFTPNIFLKPYKHPYMIRCYDNVIISNTYLHEHRYRERDAVRCSETRNIILFIWVKVNDSKCRFV